MSAAPQPKIIVICLRSYRYSAKSPFKHRLLLIAGETHHTLDAQYFGAQHLTRYNLARVLDQGAWPELCGDPAALGQRLAKLAAATHEFDAKATGGHVVPMYRHGGQTVYGRLFNLFQAKQWNQPLVPAVAYALTLGKKDKDDLVYASTDDEYFASPNLFIESAQALSWPELQTRVEPHLWPQLQSIHWSGRGVPTQDFDPSRSGIEVAVDVDEETWYTTQVVPQMDYPYYTFQDTVIQPHQTLPISEQTYCPGRHEVVELHAFSVRAGDPKYSATRIVCSRVVESDDRMTAIAEFGARQVPLYVLYLGASVGIAVFETGHCFACEVPGRGVPFSPGEFVRVLAPVVDLLPRENASENSVLPRLEFPATVATRAVECITIQPDDEYEVLIAGPFGTLVRVTTPAQIVTVGVTQQPDLELEDEQAARLQAIHWDGDDQRFQEDWLVRNQRWQGPAFGGTILSVALPPGDAGLTLQTGDQMEKAVQSRKESTKKQKKKPPANALFALSLGGTQIETKSRLDELISPVLETPPPPGHAKEEPHARLQDARAFFNAAYRLAITVGDEEFGRLTSRPLHLVASAVAGVTAVLPHWEDLVPAAKFFGVSFQAPQGVAVPRPTTVVSRTAATTGRRPRPRQWASASYNGEAKRATLESDALAPSDTNLIGRSFAIAVAVHPQHLRTLRAPAWTASELANDTAGVPDDQLEALRDTIEQTLLAPDPKQRIHHLLNSEEGVVFALSTDVLSGDKRKSGMAQWELLTQAHALIDDADKQVLTYQLQEDEVDLTLVVWSKAGLNHLMNY